MTDTTDAADFEDDLSFNGNTGRLRLVLATALGLIIVGGTADLILDKPSTWLSAHVLFEVTIIAGALLMATTLWLGWWNAAKAVVTLQHRLETQEAERDRWKESSRDALEGLGRAINEQFATWQFTPAEREVALLVLKGYGHKQIAAMTGRSERTVRQHAGVAYHKAGLGGRAELSAYFLQDLILPDAEREVFTSATPPQLAHPQPATTP